MNILFTICLGLFLVSYFSVIVGFTSLSTVAFLSHHKYCATKANEVLFCTECGVEHIKWVGKCTSCNEWNTVKPFKASPVSKIGGSALDSRSNIGRKVSSSWLPQSAHSNGMVSMSSIDINQATRRTELWSNELNRVLGGGLVPGSTILLAGEPGIGKSTLLLQIANDLVTRKIGTVVYISGEENPQQIASRAARLQLGTDDVFVLCDEETENVGTCVLL
jgi:DNA repair protein RadA/Sms